MRRFVIGDIHGAHRAMVQCFERSGFDRENDLLICLGDLCDSWPDVDKVFEELLRIRNLTLLLGNHDQWLLDWFLTGESPDIWLMQGGDITVTAFKGGVPSRYVELLKSAGLYHILGNNLFVHGGFLPDRPIEQQDKEIFLWDRSLVKTALLHKHRGEDVKITRYNKVYVGHTPTINYSESKPIIACGVCMLDTGAGWPGGVLTIMDIDTGEYCSSDVVNDLYNEFKGRG
ncbi:MAG TPA: metallophosphoesterase [Bacteroidales bacterium]|nr:metallophosphoesterase [Bacteroidales bacterium]